MPRRGDVAAATALALLFGLVAGCSTSVAPEVEVGHHRVRFVLPEGWEHLDHGRQQLIRKEEAQISLVDLGPATRAAMAREIRAAERLWRAGRRQDAFQRVRDLRAPALHFASSQRLADFWRPWNEATYPPETADSAAIGAAFDTLSEGALAFEEPGLERTLAYVLALTQERRGREVVFRRRRLIHGSGWLEIETWDRVSHLNRARKAYLVNDGYLLVLAVDRGVFDRMRPAYNDLLTSLDVTPETEPVAGAAVNGP